VSRCGLSLLWFLAFAGSAAGCELVAGLTDISLTGNDASLPVTTSGTNVGATSGSSDAETANPDVTAPSSGSAADPSAMPDMISTPSADANAALDATLDSGPAADADVQPADVVESVAPDGGPAAAFVLTGSTPTPTRGAPGKTTPSVCPDDQVVIGYRGTLSSSGIMTVWSLQLVCGRVTLTGQAPFHVGISPGATLPPQGLNGVSPFSATCPTDQVIIGVRGHSGSAIDQVGFGCAPLTRSPDGTINVDASAGTTAPAYGGPGGVPFDDRCPAGQVVRGCDTSTANGYLGSVDVICAVPSAPVCDDHCPP